MIISHQEIAIHLKNIRNLSGYTNGKFNCRISISSQTLNKHINAIPVNIIQKQQSKNQNRSQYDQQSFITKSFVLKMGSHAELNEIYIFKLIRPLDNHAENLQKIVLNIQLIHIDSIKSKVVSSYKGVIHKSCMNSYLQIDFYDSNPCQIIGSIHSCTYKYEFNHDKQGVNLKTFCQKYYKENINEMLQYLKIESQKNKSQLIENYKAINLKPLKINNINIISKKNQKINRKDIAQRETQMRSDDQTIAQQQTIQNKPQRKKIFSTLKDQKLQKYQIYQSILHENSQSIYTLWRQLLVSLFTQGGNTFIQSNKQLYHKNLKEKVGQSIVRFKGSWDNDIYNDQQEFRNKLSDKLRSKGQFDQQEIQNSSMNQVYNQIFFSKIRPIFFEQKSEKNLIEGQQPQDILVVLVHGLGASRLDMQKIKIQLKRYYDKKVRFYISSTNQGRTQGDIEVMGQRLAVQLDYQFIKYSNLPQLCFVGHSMGGLIIRAALPRLQKYKQNFHSLITLSSPHLGYTYSTSKIVDAGLWFVNTMKKCTSILQMTMKDNQKIEQTFLYKLSTKPGLQWFKKITLLASYQDSYVPYHSARIQKNDQSISDAKKQNKKGIIHSQMIQNILNRINGSLIRLNINFCIPQQNFNNLIGRAAHISFINNVEMARTLVLSGHHYFF